MRLSNGSTHAEGLKRVFPRAFACVALLILPSCGIPDLRPPKPGLPTSPKYDLPQVDWNSDSGLPEVFPEKEDEKKVDKEVTEGQPAENSAGVKVEEFFQDPVLSSLINEALVGNYELKILSEDVRVASNDFWGRTGEYLPFVRSAFTLGEEKLSEFTPIGVAERELNPLPGKPFPFWPANFIVGANITWEIDIWRQLRNARDATRLRYFATAEGRNFVVTRLVADVAENYYRLMALDARMQKLNDIIAFQEQSLKFALAAKEAARGTELAVQRFQASVRQYQSEKLIVAQEITETENQLNFLLGRYPQRVERHTGNFVDLDLHALGAGLPSQILQNRPDVRQAERELGAAGLDVRVARVNFYPKLAMAGPMGPGGPFSPIGWQAYDVSNLFRTPEAMIASIAADIVTPIINKRGIQAEYQNANARQLQALYNYQEIILRAFNEVYNRLSRVRRYAKSIEIKKEQVTALELSVRAATDLFQNPRADTQIDYLDVLTAQNDLLEAQIILIETKMEQLVAVVTAYQALGGGGYLCPLLDPMKLQPHPRWFTGKFFATSPKVLPPRLPWWER